jgi:hypothetical protein
MRSKQNDGFPPFWSITRYKKARARAARQDKSLLLDYADAAGSGMGQAFGDYRRDGDERSLQEIGEALMTLSAVVAELQARSARDANHV